MFMFTKIFLLGGTEVMLKPITIFTAVLVALSTTVGCTTTNQSDESATQPNQTATQTGTTETYPATPQSTTTPITQTTTPTDQNTTPISNQEFVTQAAQGNLAEIQLGQLAQKKAASTEVKQYGQQMITDHTQAHNQLKQLAAQKKLTVPQSVSEQDKQVAEKLSKLSGPNFDQAYMNQMVQDHQKTISLFQREAEQGQDPDLKAFATKTLPTLQQHLQQAQSLAGNTTGTTTP
jgi:putative membrane protein